MRKRSLQNSASSRRSSVTVIDVSSDSVGPSTQQMDERPMKTPWQELAHSQGLDEHTDVPDAADYQVPFGEEAGKISECSLLDDMKTQLDQLSRERIQEREEQRDETKRELDELRKEIKQDLQEMRNERRNELYEMRDERRQELQEMRDERRQELHEMRDERRQELRNEIHEIREDIKYLVDAVRKTADDTKASVQEN